MLSLLLYWLASFVIFSPFLGFPAFLLFRWCLRQNHWFFRGLVSVAALACVLGCGYGVLRLTGAIILPGDNTYSFNFFDTTWRDDGAGLLLVYGGFIISIAAALVSARRAGAAK